MNRAVGLGAVAVLALGAAGCGDNLDDPPALQPADTLVIVAHFDDDTIFMQPELHTPIASGSGRSPMPADGSRSMPGPACRWPPAAGSSSGTARPPRPCSSIRAATWRSATPA